MIVSKLVLKWCTVEAKIHIFQFDLISGFSVVLILY